MRDLLCRIALKALLDYAAIYETILKRFQGEYHAQVTLGTRIFASCREEVEKNFEDRPDLFKLLDLDDLARIETEVWNAYHPPVKGAEVHRAMGIPPHDDSQHRRPTDTSALPSSTRDDAIDRLSVQGSSRNESVPVLRSKISSSTPREARNASRAAEVATKSKQSTAAPISNNIHNQDNGPRSQKHIRLLTMDGAEHVRGLSSGAEYPREKKASHNMENT